MRTFIIGDVHGCLDELDMLLDALDPRPGDAFVFAGDLLDKGPDSAGVVRRVRRLRYDVTLVLGNRLRYDVTLVLGNHEEKHARVRRLVARGGHAAVESFRDIDALLAVGATLDSNDIAFLDRGVLAHRLPAHDALVVHAGIVPGMRLPRGLATLDSPDLATWSREDRDTLLQCLRVRHVTSVDQVHVTLDVTLPGGRECPGVDATVEGDALQRLVDEATARVTRHRVTPRGTSVALGRERPADTFWTNTYDGRFGHVYYGHTPYTSVSEPVQSTYATGLDLGCVFGGRLAAAVLEPGSPVTFVSVPARRVYATSYEAA